jgi:hypothetical protein
MRPGLFLWAKPFAPPMLNITNTGSIAQMIREVRGIPTRVIPYAASTALTRTAQRAAKEDLPAEMNRVFDRPTPYTLNSLFVKPSTAFTLSARVMVKDTAGSGVVPEKFLQPEVEGGGRGQKGMEKALRYAGILRSSERVVPSHEMKLDAFGNVPGSRIRSILASVEKTGGKSARGAKGSGIFAGQIGRTRGIWQRSGKGKTRKVAPLFIFTQAQPQYRSRLDFTGVTERVAEKHFRNEFAVAVDALMKRNST